MPSNWIGAGSRPKTSSSLRNDIPPRIILSLIRSAITLSQLWSSLSFLMRWCSPNSKKMNYLFQNQSSFSLSTCSTKKAISWYKKSPFPSNASTTRAKWSYRPVLAIVTLICSHSTSWISSIRRSWPKTQRRDGNVPSVIKEHTT